jgi:hypothetical protein
VSCLVHFMYGVKHWGNLCFLSLINYETLITFGQTFVKCQSQTRQFWKHFQQTFKRLYSLRFITTRHNTIVLIYKIYIYTGPCPSFRSDQLNWEKDSRKLTKPLIPHTPPRQCRNSKSFKLSSFMFKAQTFLFWLLTFCNDAKSYIRLPRSFSDKQPGSSSIADWSEDSHLTI